MTEKNAEPLIAPTQKMQSKYSNLQFNTNSVIAVYEEAIKQVNEIIIESKTEK